MISANRPTPDAPERRPEARAQRRSFLRRQHTASTLEEMRHELTIAVEQMQAVAGQAVGRQAARQPADRFASALLSLRRFDTLLNKLTPAVHLQLAPAIMASVDVCALVATEMTAIEAAAVAAGITLDVDICTRDHVQTSRFRCDAVQLSQVLKNVLLNAIKFSGRGGRVQMSCHREHGALTLEVSDNGPGVPVAERQAIFESGVRGAAASIAAGSGIGLAVVRTIVRAHGGTVSVADSPSGGARFRIRFPGETNGADACSSSGTSAPPQYSMLTPVA